MKEPNDLEFVKQKAGPEKDENAIDFKRSGVKEKDEEDIALNNFIESLQKQTDEENFPKITGWLWYRT